MKNLIIIMSGPSGVGKGTLVKKVLESNDNVCVSVSCTTRDPRIKKETNEKEIDGKDYFFISDEKFAEMVAEDAFLEYDEHHKSFYGTPKKFVEETVKKKDIILEIDVKGAMQVKAKKPEAILIMIVPPSIEELRRRLTGRNTETAEQIEDRMRRVEFELSQKDKYDYVIVNDDLAEATKRILSIIQTEKSKF